MLRPADTAEPEDWATAELSVTVVHAHRRTELAAPPGRIKLGDELVLEKPEGVQGTVTVTTWSQATRAAEGDPDLKPPPGLEAFPERFQPVGREGTRSVGSASFVLGLDLDENSRQLVTPDNPLRLYLPVVAGEEMTEVLPVIYDGEDYLLAGYGGDRPEVIELVNLPAVAAPTRGMGRTLRLFLYKRMGRRIPEFGLRRRVVEDGKVGYGTVSREQLQSGDKVAVLVHGFKEDTGWFIQNMAPTLLEEILPYDHVLTWDYETWGTSIEETGEDFARALKQQCGFGPDDGITVHVYAHSMGTLVSRTMIELSGGHEMVDGLCLAGPPNQGTTLINVAKGAAFLVMTGLNQVSKVPAIGLVSWPLKELFKAGEGFADLAVNSPLQRKLNGLDKPDNVPYLVLAGKNLPDPQRGRFNRLAQKVFGKTLDAIFGEDNDTAIGLSSLRGVRGEAYPRLTIEELPCDHSGYYVIPEGRDAIMRWVGGLPAS
jgi:pimeloyl-ACP methyl ester carboxylesterase